MPKDEDKLQEAPPPASTPSDSSSPGHEFSFTVSSSSAEPVDDSTKSPADDIFFHGHLLPLQILSHLPPPPPPPLSPSFSTSNSSSKHFPGFQINDTTDYPQEQKESSRAKPKPSTVFWPSKFRKIFQVKEKQDQVDENPKNKSTFDVKFSHVLKKYMKMVRPILSTFTRSRRRRRRTSSMQVHKQTHSFSGFRESKEMKRGRGVVMQQRSAPASMRTSPTNSARLLPNVGIPSYTSDSTMEEFQAAIQAAITHCKNSFAMDDHKKSHVVD